MPTGALPERDHASLPPGPPQYLPGQASAGLRAGGKVAGLACAGLLAYVPCMQRQDPPVAPPDQADDTATAIPEHALGRGLEWLARSDLRPTRQRVTLAALLVGDGRDRHVTAESLFASSRAAGEKVSLATVYNTLRAFCDAGLLNEVTVDGSRSYFDTRMDEHPHYYWEDEAVLTDAPADTMRIHGLPAAPAGTEVARVDVVIRLRRRS